MLDLSYLSLPFDPSIANHSRQVMGAFYSTVEPKQASKPKLLAYNHVLAQQLGNDFIQPQRLLEVLVGNQRFQNFQPYATCYGGHQFGHWAGQLGDGRAIHIADIRDIQGHLQQLQLKGAGQTPYSRHADGLAVLRSSMREYLCSEAMYHLGIKTTRALSLALSGDQVMRDMFYDGHLKAERGAIVCRVAESFLRFGHFQLPAMREDKALLQTLVDFTLKHYYPDVNDVVGLFQRIASLTIDMVIDWMRVGFVHGVMNTDNMSILGLTIDFGPYGWLEKYEPLWTPNTTDAEGRRYCFANQVNIALWNLAQLGSAFYRLTEALEPLQEVLKNTVNDAEQKLNQMWCAKMGLSVCDDHIALAKSLQQLLEDLAMDYTLFFSLLGGDQWLNLAPEHQITYFTQASYLEKWSYIQENQLLQWLKDYSAEIEEGEHRAMMNQVNPKFILRNYLVYEAIEACEKGDMQPFERLYQALQSPYKTSDHDLLGKRPKWAETRAGCSMLSCSS